MIVSKKKSISITIVIPAFNEEDNIAYVLKNTLQNLPKYFKDFEIIIVDDGSTDKTGIIADKIAVNNDQVKVIHHKNTGFSKALYTGIMAAKKNFVAYMPADGQFLVDDMRHCFEVANKADLILGYRGGRTDYSQKRIFLSYGYLLLLLILFNVKFMDVGWVIIWRTKKVQKIKVNYLGGIFILTEILVRFRRMGFKIIEAPSYYRPRRAGGVKNAKIKVVFQTFISALKLFIELQNKNSNK